MDKTITKLNESKTTAGYDTMSSIEKNRFDKKASDMMIMENNF